MIMTVMLVISYSASSELLGYMLTSVLNTRCHTDLGANVMRWPRLIAEKRRFGFLAAQ